MTSASSKTTSMGMSGTGAIDDEARAAQQVHLGHRHAATHGDHARHAFGQRALTGGMNLHYSRESDVERRRRDQLFRIRRPLRWHEHPHDAGAIGVLPLLARAETALRERRIEFAHRSRTFRQRHG